MKKLSACCGLDCEKCDARVATVNNDDVLREKTAKLWSEMNHVPITKEMINCMGCASTPAVAAPNWNTAKRSEWYLKTTRMPGRISKK